MENNELTKTDIIHLIIGVAFIALIACIAILCMNRAFDRDTIARQQEQIEELEGELVDYDLLPCPFCGSTNVEVEGDHESGYRVVCKECGGRTPSKYLHKEEDGERYFDYSVSKQDAVKMWNNLPGRLQAAVLTSEEEDK